VRRIALFALVQLIFLSACGGGGSTLASSTGPGPTGGSGQNIASPGPNVVTVTVDQGPSGLTSGVALNTPYISVQVCAPGSMNICQTIDHVEVDNGSYGLRIISPGVLSATLLAALPQATVSNAAVVECTQFGDGFAWGSVRNADVHISSETASNIPIQIIGDPGFPNIPTNCSNVGPSENTVDTFGANGILGVGPFVQDCADCTTSTQSGFYYACSSNGTTCTPTLVASNQIVPNPVASFMTDNNGVILEISPVADQGALTGSGVLVFGIDTESNNMLGSATVLTTDTLGFITVNYKGTPYIDGFIDSGSNLLYFNDSITTCNLGSTSNPQLFFCPASEESLSAINISANNVQSTVSFNVANAQTQFNNNPSFAAFDNVAAPYTADPKGFDFGMPFFYGRNVYTAIQGKNTSGGMGPYFAY
jgi:Protein of unknown function (DUF3443)